MKKKKLIQYLLDTGLYKENEKKLRNSIEEIYTEKAKVNITKLFGILKK